MSRLAVIAIGGNSITKAGQVGTIKEQFANAAETAEHVASIIIRGWDVVLTHGNGPQVGNVLMRVELAAKKLVIAQHHFTELQVKDWRGKH